MNPEKSLISLIRKSFSRELTPKEIDLRIKTARDLAVEMKNDKNLGPLVDEVFMFGSMIYGRPKVTSDVDLAIVTTRDDFLGMSDTTLTDDLHDFTDDFVRSRGEYFEIHCTICPRGWIETPEPNELQDDNFYYKIVARGRKIL